MSSLADLSLPSSERNPEYKGGSSSEPKSESESESETDGLCFVSSDGDERRLLRSEVGS